MDSSEKPDFFDIHATMFGGIPEKEIDELSKYWKACVQFPVKWNAFSDRNGMLFSGLTEWLSDTNGMAQ